MGCNGQIGVTLVKRKGKAKVWLERHISMPSISAILESGRTHVTADDYSWFGYKGNAPLGEVVVKNHENYFANLGDGRWSEVAGGWDFKITPTEAGKAFYRSLPLEERDFEEECIED